MQLMQFHLESPGSPSGFRQIPSTQVKTPKPRTRSLVVTLDGTSCDKTTPYIRRPWPTARGSASGQRGFEAMVLLPGGDYQAKSSGSSAAASSQPAAASSF